MNRSKRLLLIGFIFSLSLVFYLPDLWGQGYTEKIVRDSVKISYKWKKVNLMKKESPYVLMLQLQNLSETEQGIEFTLLYYWKAQLHSSSEPKVFCLKPGKKIQGRKWGLAFESSVFTLDNYLDPMFTWYIEDWKVTADSCKANRQAEKP